MNKYSYENGMLVRSAIHSNDELALEINELVSALGYIQYTKLEDLNRHELIEKQLSALLRDDSNQVGIIDIIYNSFSNRVDKTAVRIVPAFKDEVVRLLSHATKTKLRIMRVI